MRATSCIGEDPSLLYKLIVASSVLMQSDLHCHHDPIIAIYVDALSIIHRYAIHYSICGLQVGLYFSMVVWSDPYSLVNKLDMTIFSSYLPHNYIRLFRNEILTTIFVLGCIIINLSHEDRATLNWVVPHTNIHTHKIQKHIKTHGSELRGQEEAASVHPSRPHGHYSE